MNAGEKIDFETFYKNLQEKFPDLRSNPVWQKWDWSNDSCEQIVVISAVAREMIKWAENNDWRAVESMLNEIEYAFTKGSDPLVAYLGTDFTVTVMEGKNDGVRGRIKQLMGEKTFAAYQINLRGYTEL